MALLGNKSLAFMLCCFFVTINANHTPNFSTRIRPTTKLKEKISYLHFYWHDTLSGRNPTAVRVAEAPSTKTSPTLFGSVMMIDDPLTERPELSSKLLGRAQGFYASAGQQELGLLMTMNFAFVDGKYNGSTICILGRNPVFTPVREMPVVGGSGIFRLARGYALAKTHWLDLKTGDATVEYNVVVMHY